MTSSRSEATKDSKRRDSLDPHAAGALAEELDDTLKGILNAWFSRCVDKEHGGFLSDFNYKWKASGPQLKMLEYQARMTRVAARAAAYPGLESYREIAVHGFNYLKDVMWDHEHGGWFRMLDRTGSVREAGTKHGHGTSYGIAACAAYYELTSDPEGLDLAKKAFMWLDNIAHDDEHGGYFAFYQRDGTRINSSEQSPTPHAARDCIGTPFGLKDANTNSDVLEALADLLRFCSDARMKGRLAEMLHIVRDRMIVPPGSIHMYFQPDWTPVPDFGRYGYAVRITNILAKASRYLGLDTDSKTPQVIKSVVDTLLRYAWDQSKGGFFYGGSTFGPTRVEDIIIFAKDKFWWPQAEGMSMLLRMALVCPDNEMDYLQKFKDLRSYINKYMIDWKRGGWYWVGLDSSPRRWRQPKATVWKDASHEVLPLMDCIRMLKSGP